MMATIEEQIAATEVQIKALQAQKAALEQQLAEDPQRMATRDEVAARAAGIAFWGKIGLQVSTALHPDWATLEVPLEGVEILERTARLQLVEQVVKQGGKRGKANGQALVHREWAERVLKQVAEEFGW